MTKTLKRRFIIFTMTAVTCLLIFIVLAINGLNWVMLERESNTVLETLVGANGSFHKMDFDRPPPFSRHWIWTGCEHPVSLSSEVV